VRRVWITKKRNKETEHQKPCQRDRKTEEKEMPQSRKLTSGSGSVHLVKSGGKQTFHHKDL
jgi:hypothetical protein